MGELQTAPFQFTFNGFLKVAFQGSRITSDAGLILVRELDERLGLAGLIAAHLRDSRHGLNTQFRLPDLLRQSVYSRLAGYEDLNDAQRLSTDPTFRLIGSPTRWDRSAALTSTLHWFETELLTREENLVGLMAVNRDLVGQAETFAHADRVVLDMDSSESPVHGQQEGSAYNGHFETVCYHPLFLFNDDGDCLAAKLRPGNVSSANDWDELLVPEIERQQAQGNRGLPRRRRLRIYAAGDKYIRRAGGTRRPVRDPDTREQELGARDRRHPVSSGGTANMPHAIGPVQECPLSGGQLDHASTGRGKSRAPRRRAVPARRLHAVSTNLPLQNRAVVRFYNKRGTAEQWIKEGKQAAHWTRLSCHRFRANEVRLQLSVLAYNLGNLWRRLVLPKRIDTWSLTSLQQRLVKTGGRLVKHLRAHWLLLAESHLTRHLFGAMLQRIWALPVPAG